MIRKSLQRRCGLAAMVVFSVSVLTACAISWPVGLAGIIISLITTVLLFGLGTSQTGCESTTTACLSMSVDACLSIDATVDGSKSGKDATLDQGTLSDADIGPCLSPPLDSSVGPCLSPPFPDSSIGPCLSPPPPDSSIGPCLSPPPPDSSIGPCLSPPPPGDALLVPPAQEEDPGVPKEALARHAVTLDEQRDAILAKLQHRLPQDILVRLQVKADEKKG